MLTSTVQSKSIEPYKRSDTSTPSSTERTLSTQKLTMEETHVEGRNSERVKKETLASKFTRSLSLKKKFRRAGSSPSLNV
jgi:hypothetical protein